MQPYKEQKEFVIVFHFFTLRAGHIRNNGLKTIHVCILFNNVRIIFSTCTHKCNVVRKQEKLIRVKIFYLYTTSCLPANDENDLDVNR